jgi:hypothetical protein
MATKATAVAKPREPRPVAPRASKPLTVRPEVHERFLAVVERADKRAAEEDAARKARRARTGRGTTHAGGVAGRRRLYSPRVRLQDRARDRPPALLHLLPGVRRTPATPPDGAAAHEAALSAARRMGLRGKSRRLAHARVPGRRHRPDVVAIMRCAKHHPLRTSPFLDAPRMRSVVWCEPRLRAEISYPEMVRGRLRAPSWRALITT